MSAGGRADYVMQTIPVADHAILDHAAEVLEILMQVEHQRLDGGAPGSNRVREAPAVYGVLPLGLEACPVCCRRSPALTLPV